MGRSLNQGSRDRSKILAARARGPAYLDIVALAVCLVGFLGLIAMFLEFKRGIGGLPRTLLLLFLAMVCGPFYVALVRTPKFPFLFPPVVAVFLIYPIAAPHGLVYSTDPIFNFAFASQIVASGFWSPGAGLAFAHTYSFYPLGNVFEGYIILTTGAQGAVSFSWIEPILRLLAVPAIVFALGRRLFSTRIAVLGLFFYLGTGSILFNIPVQQGIGIIFVGLSLLALIMLTRSAEETSQRRAQILFALVSGGIVMTHHLSSYIFAGWLATLAIMMSTRRFRPVVGSLRLGVLFLYFIALLAIYISFFTYAIFASQQENLYVVLERLVAPENLPVAGPSPGLGRTFALQEIVWLGASVLGLLVLALASLYRSFRAREQPFAVANGLVAITITIVTLPLIATSFNFVPLRVGEYTNLFVGPFAGATLIRWSGAVSGRFGRLAPRFSGRRDWVPRAACVALAAALYMGGNLAPLSVRAYFESADAHLTDTPLNFGADALRLANWAQVHYCANWAQSHNCTARYWGDQLAVDILSGFAPMRTQFGSLKLFENATLDKSVWSELSVGDYVVTDRWMLVMRPNFFLERSLSQLPRANVEKFATDPHFALVYQDGTFSVYQVVSRP